MRIERLNDWSGSRVRSIDVLILGGSFNLDPSISLQSNLTTRNKKMHVDKKMVRERNCDTVRMILDNNFDTDDMIRCNCI